MEGFNSIPPQEEPLEVNQHGDLPITESNLQTDAIKNTPEKPNSTIEVTESLKIRWLDFTESLRAVNGKISRANENAEVISPKAVGGFRMATRNLEDVFSSKEINLDDASNSFGRLISSFEDLSLIQDRDLRKITDDARKALVHAIDGSLDSATALKRDESMEQLRKKINTMLDKAGDATNRLRRGVRS